MFTSKGAGVKGSNSAPAVEQEGVDSSAFESEQEPSDERRKNEPQQSDEHILLPDEHILLHKSAGSDPFLKREAGHHVNMEELRENESSPSNEYVDGEELRKNEPQQYKSAGSDPFLKREERSPPDYSPDMEERRENESQL